MKGKRIKQINNLIIYFTSLYKYAVWSPYGICLEDRLTLEQAEEFCRKTTDFVLRKQLNVADKLLGFEVNKCR